MGRKALRAICSLPFTMGHRCIFVGSKTLTKAKKEMGRIRPLSSSTGSGFGGEFEDAAASFISSSASDSIYVLKKGFFWIKRP